MGDSEGSDVFCFEYSNASLLEGLLRYSGLPPLAGLVSGLPVVPDDTEPSQVPGHIK